MKSTRGRFKQCLRFCKSNDDRVRADALANKLLKRDDISFRKDVSKTNRINSNVLASTINGVSGECNITKMWHDYYSDLLNSNGDTEYMPYVNSVNKCIDITSGPFFKFSVSEIRDAITNLKSNESAGTDCLQSEHFKYADPRLFCILCMKFNAMFSHGYLPPTLMETIIIPIFKNKKGLVMDKDNYRPVAVTTVVSKIIELNLLDSLHDKLGTLCNQLVLKASMVLICVCSH